MNTKKKLNNPRNSTVLTNEKSITSRNESTMRNGNVITSRNGRVYDERVYNENSFIPQNPNEPVLLIPIYYVDFNCEDEYTNIGNKNMQNQTVNTIDVKSTDSSHKKVNTENEENENSKYKDVMIDIETLGLNPGCVICTIAACVIKPDIRDCDKFYVRVIIESCEEYGLKIEDKSLEWWGNQEEQAKNEIFNVTTDRYDLPTALDFLSKWLKEKKLEYVWAKDPDFDCAILGYAYKICGKKVPWEYYKTRSVRTLLDIAGRFLKVKVTKYENNHISIFDCINQTKEILPILDSLNLSDD